MGLLETEGFIVASRVLIAAGYTGVASVMWFLFVRRPRSIRANKPERLLLFVTVTYSVWAIFEWHLAIVEGARLVGSAGLRAAQGALHLPLIVVGLLVAIFLHGVLVESCEAERLNRKAAKTISKLEE